MDMIKMIEDSKVESKARLSELKHIKNFIEMLIKARKEELKEAKKRNF